MAKLTERVAIANGDISDDDLIHIVHDAGGTPISYKMTVGQLKTFISAITGSGVDNQIAVYNGNDTIEGDASLTWDGNTIRVTGDASNKAQLTLDSDSTQNAVINLNTNGGASNSVIQFQVSDLTKYMVGINGEDDDATNQMFIITNGDSFDDDGVIVMKPNGNVGIGLGNSGEPSANKLEVGGADTTNASLKIRPQSGTPTTPESGQLRNDAGAPMWYDGSAWVDLAGGGGGGLQPPSPAQQFLIPYINASGTDAEYDSNFFFNPSSNKFRVGSGSGDYFEMQRATGRLEIYTASSRRIRMETSAVSGGGYISSNTGSIWLQASSSGSYQMWLDRTNKRVGIYTSTPTATLEVKGEGTTSGTSTLKVLNSSSASLLEVKDNGVINASNLPTSSAGLSSGDIYNDAGTLKIV